MEFSAKASSEKNDATRFIFDVDERLGSVENDEEGIPVIDLQGEHASVVSAVAEACEKWGFFQVINHGIQDCVLEAMLRVAKEYFTLPTQEKEACNVLGNKLNHLCDDPAGVIKYGVGFNPDIEKVIDWRDTLRMHCTKVKELNAWPANPSSFQNVVSEYIENIPTVVKLLLAIISEGLSLDSARLWENFGNHHRHVLMMNYYPRYHTPDLLKGVSEHSDPMGVTVLIQDGVGGLEVCKNGRWFAVKPVVNALVVNLGDQMQILTNGKYKSVEHRVRINGETERVSIPSFYGPNLDTNIAPIPELVDETSGVMYKESSTREYLTHFFSKALTGKTALDYVKI